MPDSGRDSGRDLERELRELGSRVEYPPTPGLARAARQRIEEEEEARAARRGRFWLPPLSPRWAAAAMFVLVLGVPAFSPAARDALSGLLSVGGGASYGAGGAAQSAGKAEDAAGGAESQSMAARAQSAPSRATADTIPESAVGGQTESLYGGNAKPDEKYAERITFQEARLRAGDAPVLLPHPPGLEKPDAVYGIRAPYGTRLALVYRARPRLPSIGDTGVGMVLTQAPGDLKTTYLRNRPDKATLEEVRVGNGHGYWRSSTRATWIPVMGRNASPSRSASPPESILLWEQNGYALRLESNLDKEQAIRIAESVR